MLVSRSYISNEQTNSTVKVVFDEEQAKIDLQKVKNNCKKLCISNKELNKKYIVFGVLICMLIITLASVLLPYLYINHIGVFANLDVTCFSAAFVILMCFGIFVIISNSLEEVNEEIMIAHEICGTKYEYLEHVAPYKIISIKRRIINDTDGENFVKVIFVLEKNRSGKKVNTYVEEYEMYFDGVYSKDINEETLDIEDDTYYIPYIN